MKVVLTRSVTVRNVWRVECDEQGSNAIILLMCMCKCVSVIVSVSRCICVPMHTCVHVDGYEEV